jgi:hypothetical protein
MLSMLITCDVPALIPDQFCSPYDNEDDFIRLHWFSNLLWIHLLQKTAEEGITGPTWHITAIII